MLDLLSSHWDHVPALAIFYFEPFPNPSKMIRFGNYFLHRGGEEFNYNVDLSNQQTWCASRSHPHCHLGLPEHGQVDGGPFLGTQYHYIIRLNLVYKRGFCLLFINLSIPPVVERRTWLGVSCRSGPRIKVNFFFDNFLSPAHKQGLFLPPWNAAPVGSVQL